MASTTPNKETIRRLCILSGASQCYLRVNTGDDYAEVLADIKEKELQNCLQSLKDWCGMKFRLYSMLDHSTENLIYLDMIKTEGEKLYPHNQTKVDA